MQYAIKQRIMSFGDDFDIKTIDGKKAYFVDGKAYSFVENLAVKDMARNELLRIKKKLFTFLPTFTIAKKGRLLATIKKRPFTLRTRLSIDMPGTGNWEVVGNLFRYDYSLNRDGQQIAKVSKKIFSFSDSYGIDIVDNEQNPEVILAIAIVIDMLLHNKKK